MINGRVEISTVDNLRVDFSAVDISAVDISGVLNPKKRRIPFYRDASLHYLKTGS